MQRVVLFFIIIAGTTVFSGCGTPEVPVATTERQHPLDDLEDDFDTVLNAGLVALEEEGDAIYEKEQLESALNVAASDSVFFPMQKYSTLRTRKVFGQYISPDSGDRFSGYHTGDDVEVPDVSAEYPVHAAVSGTVVRKQWVNGYGGVVIIEFNDPLNQDDVYHALYGHLDLESVKYVVGDTVPAGNQIGVLGDHESEETDGEREHLHFGIYAYTGSVRFAGYVNNEADLNNWENPYDFLTERFANKLPAETISDDLTAAVQDIVNQQNSQ